MTATKSSNQREKTGKRGTRSGGELQFNRGVIYLREGQLKAPGPLKATRATACKYGYLIGHFQNKTQNIYYKLFQEKKGLLFEVEKGEETV